MDVFGHVAISSIMCDAIFAHKKIRTFFLIPSQYPLAVLLLFLSGAVFHILVDLLPHFDFLYRVSVPLVTKWWMKQLSVAALYFCAMFFITKKSYRTMKLFAIAGGLYPLFEKFLYFVVQLPERYVIFKKHSMHLAQTPSPLFCGIFVIFEISMAFGALGIAFYLKRRLA